MEKLMSELATKDKEIHELKLLLKQQERLSTGIQVPSSSETGMSLHSFQPSEDHLDNPSIARYSRQLILPEIGVKGQLLLGRAKILVVGCGGLGCPSALYLAAAGIGCLGLVDYDEVELSNLHRQVLHTEAGVGLSKCSSAAAACNRLNSSVKCVTYCMSLDSSNALELIKQYDVVLDCTDNVATRYLLNDACILAQKPLVSGSALRFEGQLTVYNYESGPCYRCLFPKPPPPETVTNCSDGGVLGVVPGIIGSLQALETIKIVTKIGTPCSQRLLMFDGLDFTFRTIKLRPKQESCVVCGSQPTVTQLIDYEQFCGARASDKDKELTLLAAEDRITVQRYKELTDNHEHHLLIDVRQPVELEICQLPGAMNIPMGRLSRDENIATLKDKITGNEQEQSAPVFVVCRRGNDSQEAVRILRDKLKDLPVSIKDIRGGLTAWAKHIDHNFPVY